MRSIELDKFYGRKPILDLLKRRVLDLKEGCRQNIALLGGRYIGKSIILQKFFFDLDDSDVVTIYLNLDNKDFYYFVNKFAGSILYNFSKTKNLPLHDDIKLLLESTQAHLPQTVKSIKKIQSYLSHGKRIEAYLETISLPETFAKESNQFCVLILDEFHHLEEFDIPQIFQELGKRIMTQKRCLYVVISSRPGVAKKILSEKLSLLFGDFEVIGVGPFDVRTSQEFVVVHLRGVKVGDQLRNFLIDFTGGHPLYLRLICQELVSLSAIHRQAEIFVPLMTQAIENVLFNPWGVLSCHFDLIMHQACMGKGNLVIAAIFIALSNGKKRLKDLVQEVGVKRALVHQKINHLVETEVIVKNGNFYYLSDRLFKYWIKYVFQKGKKFVDLDPMKQREQFKAEFARVLECFNKSLQKDFSARIIELFHCFENESFYINGRRYKLPFFKEIFSRKISHKRGNNFDVIKASTVDGDWMIVLKSENVGENDINTFLMESKKLKQKPQKCVLISLSNVDENARLKALQEQMWIWNERELNTLLDLYDKPYIME